MENEYMLPVIFNGKESEFPAKLLIYGFTSKMQVEIDGTKVFFELDDERNWRALISYDDALANKKISSYLLRAVAEAIEKITK
ncbi:MAG: hypothetical protein SGI83_11810 [Bacteroidota bacterium]|mgnify:CR=1 FL=1|nr:hypothetical protein [Bacteroidota bacterium]